MRLLGLVQAAFGCGRLILDLFGFGVDIDLLQLFQMLLLEVQRRRLFLGGHLLAAFTEQAEILQPFVVGVLFGVHQPLAVRYGTTFQAGRDQLVDAILFRLRLPVFFLGKVVLQFQQMIPGFLSGSDTGLDRPYFQCLQLTIVFVFGRQFARDPFLLQGKLIFHKLFVLLRSPLLFVFIGRRQRWGLLRLLGLIRSY